MPDVRNVFVLGNVSLDGVSIALNADGKPESWVQVCKTGKNFRHGTRKFDITETMLNEMVSNSERSTTQIPIDYHHLSLGAQNADQALAAGWFNTLEVRNSEALWGLAEWTPKAAKHIEDKEFRYISPTFLIESADEQGHPIGSSLLSAALTIYPFLKGMAPVALSELTSMGIVCADFSIDEKRARLASAIEALDQTSYCYLIDVYDDYVVYQKRGKKYRIDYTLSSKGEVSFNGDPKEVVVEYAILSVPSGGPTPMPAPAQTGQPAAAANNQPTGQPANQPVVASNQSAANQPAAPVTGQPAAPELLAMQQQIETLTTTVNALSTRVDTERARADELQTTLNKERATIKVKALLRTGKIVKAQEEKMIALALKDPAFFDDFATTLQPVVQLNTQHGTGETGDEDGRVETPADPVKLFEDAIQKYITDNGGKDKVKYADAMRAVSAAQPDLATAYREEYARTTAVA